MPYAAFWLTAADETPLYTHLCRRGAQGVVMLSHGMAEHAGRYARLGEALNLAGYSLYAIDQRGHGRSAEHGTSACTPTRRLGQGGRRPADPQPAYRRTRAGAADLPARPQHGQLHRPGLPAAHSDSVRGAVLSGSNFQPVALYRLARLIARFERWRQGPLGRSALIEFMSFGAFNKAFKPNRTAFDWLSRDPGSRQVPRRPLCGFRCSNQLWLDLLGGLEEISPG
jgi:alpha-beta hydrolase superfamily lysophospholipase